MNKKVKTGALSAITLIALLCLFQFTSAYFIDKETAVNVIKIGRISVELEENFTSPENTLPGRIFDKAPKLKNIGTKDEFVFLEVTVPKESVTLLNETENIGKIRKETGLYEIFRMIATYGTDETEMKIPNTQFDTTSPESKFDYDIDFSYHAPVTGNPDAEEIKAGWILIKANSTEKSNSYVFAYNKKLSPNMETVELFDRVQLKSFINEEVTGEQVIGVKPYAIQAEGLNATGLSEECKNNAIANENDLKIIYQVIQNKGEAAESNE